ncbi:MAG: four helix bundle protein [Algoriphagus sp.]|nr:four helix bundle protein [Algoriphagus sp.]
MPNRAAKFPTDEKYNLISQTRKAPDSIASNIAEGSTGQSAKEF